MAKSRHPPSLNVSNIGVCFAFAAAVAAYVGYFSLITHSLHFIML